MNQLTPESLQFQQHYINLMLQNHNNSGSNNNNNSNNRTSFETCIGNSNNQLQSKQLDYYQKLNLLNLAADNNLKASSSNVNLQYYQQNTIQEQQQYHNINMQHQHIQPQQNLFYKPLLNNNLINSSNSIYLDNGHQYSSTYYQPQFQQQQQQQHLVLDSSNNNNNNNYNLNQRSLYVDQYLTKISQPINSMVSPTAAPTSHHYNSSPSVVLQQLQNNTPHNYFNYNQDYLINDLAIRMQLDGNKIIKGNDYSIAVQTSDHVVKNEPVGVACMATTKLPIIAPINIQHDNHATNFINNLASSLDYLSNTTVTSSTPIDTVATSTSTSSLSASSYASYSFNDSSFNSNPSSVDNDDSIFSSKHSNISDTSSNFDEQINEFISDNTSTNHLEANIKSLTIQETKTQLVNNKNNNNNNNNANSNNINENSNNVDNDNQNKLLNVFIYWMDQDESLLSESEFHMRQILKQQSALNIFNTNNEQINDNNNNHNNTNNSKQ